MKGWEVARGVCGADGAEDGCGGDDEGEEQPCSEGAEPDSTGGGGALPGLGRLSASATVLDTPGVCLMSVVNSVMYTSCRC
jgi:hypothetical protein